MTVTNIASSARLRSHQGPQTNGVRRSISGPPPLDNADDSAHSEGKARASVSKGAMTRPASTPPAARPPAALRLQRAYVGTPRKTAPEQPARSERSRTQRATTWCEPTLQAAVTAATFARRRLRQAMRGHVSSSTVRIGPFRSSTPPTASWGDGPGEVRPHESSCCGRKVAGRLELRPASRAGATWSPSSLRERAKVRLPRGNRRRSGRTVKALRTGAAGHAEGTSELVIVDPVAAKVTASSRPAATFRNCRASPDGRRAYVSPARRFGDGHRNSSAERS